MKKEMEFTIPSKKNTRWHDYIPARTEDEISDYALLIDSWGQLEFRVYHRFNGNHLITASSYLREIKKGRPYYKAILDDVGQLSEPRICSAIRPMIENLSIPMEEFGTDFDYNQDQIVEYGEYPQTLASEDETRKLDSLYDNHQLKRTSKKYLSRSIHGDCHVDTYYDEYYMDGKKYVRVQAPKLRSNHNYVLSNGQQFVPEEYYWIKVEPIKWFYDKKNKSLIAIKSLLSNMEITNRDEKSKKKLKKFEDSSVYDYLNDSFKQKIIPSDTKVLFDIIWGGLDDYEYEQKAKRIAAERKKEKKNYKEANPYGFVYNEVSEEDIIKGAIESGIAVFLHGKSSDGKSARVKAIDPGCITIYLKNATPESLNGKSALDSTTGKLYDIKPTWLEKLEERCAAEPDKKHIVFFDEITNALPSLQGAAFNIVLDREVNGKWLLPPNARVVAAGNEMEDSLAANEIAEPLFNRFAHVYIETTKENWLIWASKNQIHPAIYAYIAYRGEEVLRTEYNGETPNADPRKWEMASKMLKETNNPEMLRSLIGEDLTREFIDFCKKEVITLNDVVNGNYNDADINKLDTAERYVTTMTLTQVDVDNLDSIRDFIEKMGSEYLSLFDTLWCIDDVNRKAIIEEKKGMRK